MLEYYKFSKEEILKHFKLKINEGILNKDLKYKLERYGKNEISIKKDITFTDLFIIQIKSFLNLLLLFLVFFAIFVWIYTNQIEHLIDAIIIFLIFLFNSIIGAYQNYSASKIAKALNNMLENKATIIRNNQKIKINSKDLFPGDIILLESGDKIPADAYIYSSNDLKINESLLTGESRSISKSNCIIKEEASITDMKNILFMNSYVVSGNCIAIVIQTGKNTQIGKIADAVQNKSTKVSFLTEIDEVSKKISFFAIGLILIVALILYYQNLSLISIFLVASALIIGSIPEGLPAIVVFLLSKSIHRLSKQKVLVKDMGLLETLGSIDILCTDKTGTLTQNKMSLKKLYLFGHNINSINEIKNNEITPIFEKIISYVNNVKFVDNKFVGDPEDISLINYLDENNINSNNIKKKSNIKKFEPFNSQNKYSYCEIKSENLRLKKGAPEVLIDSCKYTIIDNKKILLDTKMKSKLNKEMKKYTSQALRLIGFSYSNLKDNEEIFLGFCGLYDKPKEGIKETIEKIYDAKIDIKMITGDGKDTASAIGAEVGFRNIKAVEYNQIKDLSNQEFEQIVLTHNIFARMTPDYKERILSILQENGHRVAITGDGVNDSIALKKADVGVVMGSGSDIAKESGDLILIDDNFSNLLKAIHEGRGIFHNIRKVVNYLLTANLAEVLTIFVASFFGLIPFTAIQILWVNFVTDVAPSMALGTDKFPKHILNKKPNGKNEKILNKRIILLTILISLKKVILIFTIFLLAYNFSPIENNLIFAQSIAFTWLVLTHFVRIAAIRFDEKVKFFSNKFVNYSLLGVVILQLIIIYTFFGEYFGVVPIPFEWMLLLIIFVLIGVFLAKIITIFIKYLLKNYFKEEENY